jgi:enoyl-CoA hydratase/carnithine racemase
VQADWSRLRKSKVEYAEWAEFVLACDMRFAAREAAIFGQPQAGFGLIPGSGAVQHLTRLMGRGRALEVLLSAEDYDAQEAEPYGWINRAMPAAALGDFVKSLARRIASFPAPGLGVIKERVNIDRLSMSLTCKFRNSRLRMPVE